MKAQFVTSDWHIGHANSIKFDNRPFRDVNHMHEVLVKNYNETVPEDGICYFLGDMGMNTNGEIAKVINRLNGTKVLVLGNHDKGINMMESCFDLVVNGLVVCVAGERVTMSHCPLKGLFREDTSQFSPAHQGLNWHGELKNDRFTFSNEGQFHLHGHIHSGPSTEKKKILGRQYDVGVPANHYRPVSLVAIESWIKKSIR